MERVEVPVPVKRTAPAELMTDYQPDMPQILGHCEGDYGITRAGVEALIDAMREAKQRLNQWKAWAQ